MSSLVNVCDLFVSSIHHLLLNSSLFGIKNKEGMFIVIPSINVDNSGYLYYLDTKNRRTSVRSLIISINGLSNSPWLDHLYFIDKNANINSFTKYIDK